MAHAAALRRREACDEPDHRLRHVFFDPGRSFRLLWATDLADHQNRFGLRIRLEQLQTVAEKVAVDRIGPDADGSRDADAERLQLRSGLIAERAGARNHADRALQINMAGHNTEHRLAGADDAGAIRPNQHRAIGFRIAHHVALHPHHVLCRNAVGDRADQRHARIGSLHDAIRAKCWRHEGDAGLGARLLHRLLHSVEHRQSGMGGAAFARGHAADNVGAVVHHLFGVELAFVAGHALHDDRRLFVNQDTHRSSPLGLFYAALFHAATALSAASAKVSAVISFNPLSARIFRPSSTLVPASLTTSGTFTSTVWQACTTPFATQSQRLMPAKMLTSTARTLASDNTNFSAVAIRSGEAPPPTSRKFAGLPPACLIMSMVAMARPAPLTMQPISPSSPI